MLGVLEIEEKKIRERFGAKYLRQVSYLLDACVHLTAVYAVQRVSIRIQYQVYCIIAVCVEVL